MMRILVAGAGAVGGYAAARMLESGADVTLLVRDKRRRLLQQNGLAVISPLGDFTGFPAMIAAGEAGGPYDLIIIAMKAYGLEEALKQLQPYAGPKTGLLPFLNGIRHMDIIAGVFPGRPLLGGVARIESTLDDQGRIVHGSAHHLFTYGRYGAMTDERYAELHEGLSRIPLFREHSDIVRDLWEKYLFITVISGLTTLFDASIGEIRSAPAGMAWFERVFTEASETIRKAGGRLGDGIVERQLRTISGMSDASTSSMLRDVRRGLPAEADHIHGYLIRLAREHGVRTPLMETIYQRLVIYENKRPKSP